jgi:hypothetical protein
MRNLVVALLENCPQADLDVFGSTDRNTSADESYSRNEFRQLWNMADPRSDQPAQINWEGPELLAPSREDDICVRRRPEFDEGVGDFDEWVWFHERISLHYLSFDLSLFLASTQSVDQTCSTTKRS